LRSGAWKRKTANAKRILCQLSIGKMGCPDAKVARYPGVTTTSVNHSAVSEEAADLKKYLKMLQNLRPIPFKNHYCPYFILLYRPYFIYFIQLS
jgi:hypothetical protein